MNEQQNSTTEGESRAIVASQEFTIPAAENQ